MHLIHIECLSSVTSSSKREQLKSGGERGEAEAHVKKYLRDFKADTMFWWKMDDPYNLFVKRGNMEKTKSAKSFHYQYCLSAVGYYGWIAFQIVSDLQALNFCTFAIMSQICWVSLLFVACRALQCWISSFCSCTCLHWVILGSFVSCVNLKREERNK